MSVLGALMFASQLAMSGLPNIHIIAPLIIVCCVFFSWRALYAIFVFVMLEVLVWGLGLWVISHMYLWPILAVAAIYLAVVVLLGKLLECLENSPSILSDCVIWFVFPGNTDTLLYTVHNLLTRKDRKEGLW